MPHTSALRVFAAIAVTCITAEAGAQRLGLVAGTWEACAADCQRYRDRLQLSDDSQKTRDYLERRLTTELDRCARLRDAPVEALLEVIERYRAAGMHTRAVNLGRDGLARYGSVPALQLALGQSLLSLGDQSDAIPLLESVIKAQPDSVPAHHLLGAYYYEHGQPKIAAAHLEGVAQARPNSFDVHAALGDACLAASDLVCAERALSRALALKPEDGLLAAKVGGLAYGLGKYGSAVESFEKSLAQDATRFEAHLGLGRSLRALDLQEVAVLEYQRASDLRPAEPAPAVEGSQLYRSLGRACAGVVVTGRALAQGAPTTELRVENALALIACGRYQEVIDGGEHAPPGIDDERWFAVVGDASMASGRLAEALSNYREAARRQPQAPAYVLRVGRALRRLQRFDEARAALAPLAQDPQVLAELVATNLTQAKSLVGSGALAPAHTLLEATSALSPQAPEPKLALASIAAAQGDEERTRSLLDGIEGWQHDLVAAWAHLQAGEHDQALRVLSALSVPKASHLGAQLLRAAALMKAGKHAQARATLARLDSPEAAQWRAAALTAEARAHLLAREYEASGPLFATAIESSAAPQFESWMKRARLVGTAAQSGIGSDAAVPASNERGSASRDLDTVLWALHESAAGRARQGLEGLKRLRSSPVIERVRDRLAVDAAASLYLLDKPLAIEPLLASVRDVSSLDVQSRLNVAVLRSLKDPRRLESSVQPFAQEGLAEAWFDLALARERASNDGAQSISALQELLARHPSHPLAETASEMLRLKTRLYR